MTLYVHKPIAISCLYSFSERRRLLCTLYRCGGLRADEVGFKNAIQLPSLYCLSLRTGWGKGGGNWISMSGMSRGSSLIPRRYIWKVIYFPSTKPYRKELVSTTYQAGCRIYAGKVEDVCLRVTSLFPNQGIAIPMCIKHVKFLYTRSLSKILKTIKKFTKCI